VAPSRVEWNGDSANFGRFGSIDIHYERLPPRKVKDCRGLEREEDAGRFTGSIDFHGERHFTEVDYLWLEAHQIPAGLRPGEGLRLVPTVDFRPHHASGPFHGSASFHVKRGTRELGRWQGNLTVEFPGFRRYPLATRPTLGILKPGGCKVRGSQRPGSPVLCL
jgi:hypothetical protein